MTSLLIVGAFTVAVVLLILVAGWHDRHHCRVCGTRLSDARVGLALRLLFRCVLPAGARHGGPAAAQARVMSALAAQGEWGPWLGIDPDTRKRTYVTAPIWYPAGDSERAVVFVPGYRTSRATYGKHGMDIKWMLRGPRGVTQFMLSTGWVPGEKGVAPSLADMYPTGVDLGYHALCPQYEGQDSTECDYLPGGVCFYDGSGLQADGLLTSFLVEGEPLIWRTLAERHDALAVPTSAGRAS